MPHGHGNKLPKRLHEAVAAHLEETSHVRIAARLGVARVTWWRWRRRPEYQRAYAAEWKRRVIAEVRELAGAM